MRIGIYELLERISDKETKAEKIEELRRSRDNPTFMLLLKMSFDPNLEWKIPKSPHPYKPSQDFDQQGMFYSSMKTICRSLICTPQSPNIPDTPKGRERVQRTWLSILESLHPKDALVLIAVRDKKPLAKGLTQKLVEEAFPDLLK